MLEILENEILPGYLGTLSVSLLDTLDPQSDGHSSC